MSEKIPQNESEKNPPVEKTTSGFEKELNALIRENESRAGALKKILDEMNKKRNSADGSQEKRNE